MRSNFVQQWRSMSEHEQKTFKEKHDEASVSADATVDSQTAIQPEIVLSPTNTAPQPLFIDDSYIASKENPLNKTQGDIENL